MSQTKQEESKTEQEDTTEEKKNRKHQKCRMLEKRKMERRYDLGITEKQEQTQNATQ